MASIPNRLLDVLELMSHVDMKQNPSQASAIRRVWPLNGKTGIYIEKMRVYRIIVSDVHEHQNGFLATATALKTHGLLYSESPWKFGAAWEHLSTSEECFASTIVGWRLHTAPAAVEELLAIVAELPAGKTYREDYTSKPTVGHPRFVAKSSPGPVAKRVYEFLYDLQLRY